MRLVQEWMRTFKTIWWLVMVGVLLVMEVTSLSGSNVCMVQQKYNITKRVKYRAPMSVRSYVWCFSIPPRCSMWKTEMRDLTRLETEERTAEVAVCCPGYKMKDVSCIPICPFGKTGRGCLEDCPPNKWGPNCIHECVKCLNGFCSPMTGKCDCLEGWQGESCQISMSTTPVSTALVEEILTTTKSSVQTLASIQSTKSTSKSTIPTSSISLFTSPSMATSSIVTTMVPVISTATIEVTKPLITTTPPTSPLITTTNYYRNNTTLPFHTTMWFKNESTTITSKTPIKTFVYNRTETPELEPKGTSTHFKTEHVTTKTFIYNRTETPEPEPKGTSSHFVTEHVTTTATKTPISAKISTTPVNTKSSIIKTKHIKTTVHPTTENDSVTIEMKPTYKKFTTMKSVSSTIKFKPKEIWIKPTQKGETTYIETKLKTYEPSHTRIKSAINKNDTPIESTTPKTIVVSIIPTSITHATFKKIALTTVSYAAQKSNITSKFSKRTDGITKAIEPVTSTIIPFTIKILHPAKEKKLNVSETNRSLIQYNETYNKSISTWKKLLKGNTPEATKFNIPTAKTLFNTTMATSLLTNSMSTVNELSSIQQKSSTLLTNKSLTNKKARTSLLEITTASSTRQPLSSTKVAIHKTQNVNRFTPRVEIAKSNPIMGITKPSIKKHTIKTNTTKKTATKSFINSLTTKEPIEDETFHILTEPEHITAVMNDKEKEHTSVDLISVISIAGGVMMAIITVAVIIVMVERCKKPRYDDVRKMNEMQMHSMVDSDDEPPPYVRSIFHTPLPEPPTEKCHYQPITTLDRNLKQFMRPVVVQTISPVMLENFREILECHYDHLPRRPHDFEVPLRSSVAPSMNYRDELNQRPISVVDTIEALKCEAKFDIIDATTTEPLYAEIPCWRPPSEHAVEVNLNGEAVTEL